MSTNWSDLVHISICVHTICAISNTITEWHILLSRPVHTPCCHTDRMTERSALHLVRKQPLARMLVWESLWVSTTCSISHILSHLRGHLSSGPQPNYSTTRLTAIKRCTAGVQGSRIEPGCCHGHCHSADFQGWKEIQKALWLLVVLFWPTETAAALKTIADTVVMQLNNENMHICEYWLVFLVKLEAWQ